jgi:hypothetical protein
VPATAAAVNKLQPTQQDATSYIENMKTSFAAQPGVYKQFFAILKAFKGQSLTTRSVMSKVAKLFDGHPDFVLGFNKFLPDGFSMAQFITKEELAALDAAEKQQNSQALSQQPLPPLVQETPPTKSERPDRERP